MSSYLEKIAAAIIGMKKRKGSSLNAIKTFLHAKSSESRSINLALKKGVESGALEEIDGLYKIKIKQTKARLAKRRSIMVPGRFDIRCELDKFYEDVNAMQQQFGQQQFGQQQQWQQQHPQHQQQQAPPANTFGFRGGRRKRRSSKLKRRSRRNSKLKRRSRRSSKLKRRNN